jgi:hypothetical protein
MRRRGAIAALPVAGKGAARRDHSTPVKLNRKVTRLTGSPSQIKAARQPNKSSITKRNAMQGIFGKDEVCKLRRRPQGVASAAGLYCENDMY